MIEYENQQTLIEPQREKYLPENKTREWIAVATAAIILISAIVSLIDRSGGSEGRE